MYFLKNTVGTFCATHTASGYLCLLLVYSFIFVIRGQTIVYTCTPSKTSDIEFFFLM